MGVIDNRIFEEVKLAQTMIKEFLIKECNIDEEKLNILEEIFSQASVKYDDIDSNGRTHFDTKEIKIKNTLSLNTQRIISYLIHEYCHLFINRDFNKNQLSLEKTFNEGMCDTFSDLVVNYYFKKHDNVTCNNRILNFTLPYDSYSCYLFQNSWIRTLLYPLEKERKDKDAIVELILGDPIKFFELTMGKEFANNIPTNENGFPLTIDITYEELYLQNKNAYHNINKDSIYFRRNFILPAFIIQERIENKETDPLYLLGDNYYNEYFIANIYFDEKKIYEIQSQELIEFTELYWKARCPEKTFIDELFPFIDMKSNELTEQEIRDHSFQILKNFLYILKITDKHIKQLGSRLEHVILSCLTTELEKIRNNQVTDVTIQKLYNMLYPDVLNFFKNNNSDTCKNIYEILCSLEDIFKAKINTIDDYIAASRNMTPINNGTSKKCYDFGHFVLLESDFSVIKDKDYTIELFENLNKLGINTHQILTSTKVNGKGYILETKVPGTPIQEYTPKKTIGGEITEEEYVKRYLNRLKEISENYDILEKFVKDYFKLIELGMFVDPSKTTNFYYDKNIGISFVDISFEKCPYDTKLIMNYIMYIISWCQSSDFTKEQTELEEYYLQAILNNLNKICINLGKEPSIYMNDFSGKPLEEKIRKRKEYRYEYSHYLNGHQNTK